MEYYMMNIFFVWWLCTDTEMASNNMPPHPPNPSNIIIQSGSDNLDRTTNERNVNSSSARRNHKVVHNWSLQHLKSLILLTIYDDDHQVQTCEENLLIKTLQG